MCSRNSCITPSTKQIWTVSGVLINMVCQGMLLSHTTSLLPALRDPSSSIQADLETASMIASSVGLACIPGFFISSYLMDWRGRKQAHIIALLFGVLGWSIMYLANSITALLIGRFLAGISTGSSISLGAVVIGEFTSPESRGMFLNLKTAAVCFGSMLLHIMSNFYSWRTVALQVLVPFFAALLITLTWPESPAWLVSKRQFEKSKKAFYWLRGNDDQSNKELEELIRAQENQTMEYDHKQPFSAKTADFFAKFTRKDFLKPCIIMTFGAIILETSGRHIFPAYALQIVFEITGDKSKSFYYTLAIDLIITLSATSSSYLVKVFKRRMLLFSTGFAAAAVIMLTCTYIYLASEQIISNDRVWIPVTLFVIYFILVNLGCTPIPLALMGEIFPLTHRAAGSAVGGFMMSINLMLGLHVTPYLIENLSVHGTFTVLGATLAFSLGCLYFILPETKDKSLQEIENYFVHGRLKEDTKTGDDEEDLKIKMLS